MVIKRRPMFHEYVLFPTRWWFYRPAIRKDRPNVVVGVILFGRVFIGVRDNVGDLVVAWGLKGL